MWNSSNMPPNLYQFSDRVPMSELLRDPAFGHSEQNTAFSASEATKTTVSKHIQFNPIIAEATHTELVANANIPYNEVFPYVELYQKLLGKYTTLLEQHSTLLQSKSTPESNSSSLPPSSDSKHPSLLYIPKTFTVPLTPNDPEGATFKKTHFWTPQIFSAYETARKSAPTRINEPKGKSGPARLSEDDENTNSHYVVSLGGARVPGSRISAIRATIRACLNEFAQHTAPPETWSQATISLQDFIHKICSDRYTELTICEGNWKLDQMIQRIYWDWFTKWKKNNSQYTSVSKKRKAKDLPINALATKKTRSSSPSIQESIGLSVNAKGKQKAQSRSQSPTFAPLSCTSPLSTLGPSGSGSDSHSSSSSGSAPLSSGNSCSSSTTPDSSLATSDSSLTTSDSSLTTPGSFVASPGSGGAMYSAATSGPSAVSSGPSPGSAGNSTSATTSGPLAATSGPLAATSGPLALAATPAIPPPGPTSFLSNLDPSLSPTVDALLALSGNPPPVLSNSYVSPRTTPELTKSFSVKNPLFSRFGQPSGPTARMTGVEEFARQDKDKLNRQAAEVKTIPPGDKPATKLVYKKPTSSTTAKNLYFIDYVKKVPKITSADFDIVYKALKPEDIEPYKIRERAAKAAAKEAAKAAKVMTRKNSRPSANEE